MFCIANASLISVYYLHAFNIGSITPYLDLSKMLVIRNMISNSSWVIGLFVRLQRSNLYLCKSTRK